MSKHATLTSEQRVERARAIHANIKGLPEIALPWSPIDRQAKPFGECVKFRGKTERQRCADARCDRCYPALVPKESEEVF